MNLVDNIENRWQALGRLGGTAENTVTLNNNLKVEKARVDRSILNAFRALIYGLSADVTAKITQTPVLDKVGRKIKVTLSNVKS